MSENISNDALFCGTANQVSWLSTHAQKKTKHYCATSSQFQRVDTISSRNLGQNYQADVCARNRPNQTISSTHIVGKNCEQTLKHLL